MKITSLPKIVAGIDLNDREMRGALQGMKEAIPNDSQLTFAILEQEGEIQFPVYKNGLQGASKHIAIIRDRLLKALKGTQGIGEITYIYNPCNSITMQEDIQLREDGEIQVTNWHIDSHGDFFFCSFGDIASIEMLEGTLELKATKLDSEDETFARELLEKATAAEKDRSMKMIAIPDGNICYIDRVNIHRRGLCRKEGARHTFLIDKLV
ncbi:MAG: hypothetical protein R3B71_05395 [Candidatus Gracilibacteria bacterium]|nr:hypothetical protein [Candidatus Peregrinibacteria bacterium]HMR01424.1 hypothetical protein [Candidatus Gracilibacteria bacterium]